MTDTTKSSRAASANSQGEQLRAFLWRDIKEFLGFLAVVMAIGIVGGSLIFGQLQGLFG